MNELEGQQIHQLLELLVARTEALDQSNDQCSVGRNRLPGRVGMGVARSNAGFTGCQEVVTFVQHRHKGLHAAAVGRQCIERGTNPILAARAHLVVRAFEAHGNAHQRGTHHLSLTEQVRAANPQDA